MPVVTISGRCCWRVSFRRQDSATLLSRENCAYRLSLSHIPQDQSGLVIRFAQYSR
jgi:hypothetical protein